MKDLGISFDSLYKMFLNILMFYMKRTRTASYQNILCNISKKSAYVCNTSEHITDY